MYSSQQLQKPENQAVPPTGSKASMRGTFWEASAAETAEIGRLVEDVRLNVFYLRRESFARLCKISAWKIKEIEDWQSCSEDIDKYLTSNFNVEPVAKILRLWEHVLKNQRIPLSSSRDLRKRPEDSTRYPRSSHSERISKLESAFSKAKEIILLMYPGEAPLKLAWQNFHLRTRLLRKAEKCCLRATHWMYSQKNITPTCAQVFKLAIRTRKELNTASRNPDKAITHRLTSEIVETYSKWWSSQGLSRACGTMRAYIEIAHVIAGQGTRSWRKELGLSGRTELAKAVSKFQISDLDSVEPEFVATLEKCGVSISTGRKLFSDLRRSYQVETMHIGKQKPHWSFLIRDVCDARGISTSLIEMALFGDLQAVGRLHAFLKWGVPSHTHPIGPILALIARGPREFVRMLDETNRQLPIDATVRSISKKKDFAEKLIWSNEAAQELVCNGKACVAPKLMRTVLSRAVGWTLPSKLQDSVEALKFSFAARGTRVPPVYTPAKRSSGRIVSYLPHQCWPKFEVLLERASVKPSAPYKIIWRDAWSTEYKNKHGSQTNLTARFLSCLWSQTFRTKAEFCGYTGVSRKSFGDFILRLQQSNEQVLGRHDREYLNIILEKYTREFGELVAQQTAFGVCVRDNKLTQEVVAPLTLLKTVVGHSFENSPYFEAWRELIGVSAKQLAQLQAVRFDLNELSVDELMQVHFKASFKDSWAAIREVRPGFARLQDCFAEALWSAPGVSPSELGTVINMFSVPSRALITPLGSSVKVPNDDLEKNAVVNDNGAIMLHLPTWVRGMPQQFLGERFGVTKFLFQRKVVSPDSDDGLRTKLSDPLNIASALLNDSYEKSLKPGTRRLDFVNCRAVLTLCLQTSYRSSELTRAFVLNAAHQALQDTSLENKEIYLDIIEERLRKFAGLPTYQNKCA
jgi:hypothetical protein